MAAPKLTPSEFISLPQRSNLVPNRAGTHALYTQSIHNPTTNEATAGVYAFDLTTLRSILLLEEPCIEEPKWAGFGTQIVWTKSLEEHNEIWIGDIDDELKSSYKAADVPASVSLLQICPQSEDILALLFYGTAATRTIKHSSLKDFTSLPVQNYIGYADKPCPSLWYAKLQKSKETEKSFTFSPSGLLDVLEGTGLELYPWPFALPFGPLSCAISHDTIAYPARPSGPYRSGEYSSTLYRVSISSLQVANTSPRAVAASDHTGQCLLPTFSPSGDLLAFMRGECSANPCADKVIYILKTKEDQARQMILGTSGEAAYMEIESMQWSRDEKSLLICSTRYGRRALVQVDVQAETTAPRTLIYDSSVSGVYELHNNRLLISSSSFVCPSEYAIYDLTTSTKTVLDRLSLEKYGIGDQQISEFYCKGASSEEVQTWVLKPSFFEAGKKYPIALFMHGGPLMAWTNGWSLQWNPLVLAEQGHVVVLPNFGGSTGISSRFKQSAIGHLGDIPTDDLESCMQHATDHLSYVDPSRAIALGWSFGGYLAFWIAGKPSFAKRFKTLVSHAGVFVAPALAGSDVPDAWRILFGGLNADSKALTRAFVQWNPAMQSHAWETPMLISVGERDRWVPCTHGMGAFAALQMKGVESRLLAFPDEGHMILKPGNVLAWYEAVVEWIDKYTDSGRGQDGEGMEK